MHAHCAPRHIICSHVSFKVPPRSVLTLTSDPTASGWARVLSLPAVLDKCVPFLRDCLGFFFFFTWIVVILLTLTGEITSKGASLQNWSFQAPCRERGINKYVIVLKIFKQHWEKKVRHTTKGKHISSVSCQNTQRKHSIWTRFAIKRHGRPR